MRSDAVLCRKILQVLISVTRLHFPELEALELSRGRLRNLAKKFEPAGALIAADFLCYQLLEFVRQLLAGSKLGVQHHERGGLGEAVVIFAGDYGGFADGGVSDQGAFDLGGTEPEAVDFEEIISAAGIPKVALFILKIFVSGMEPAANKSFFCFFVLVPVAGTGRVALDEQIADFVERDVVAALIDEPRLVARNDFAARAGFRFAGTIGDDHLQRFGRAERIENFDAEAFFEALEQWSWERFAGGDGVAHAREIELASIFAVVCEKRGVIRGHREKKCGAVALDVRVDRGGRGTSGIENRRCAATEWEVAGVSETISKKEARDAEAAVAFVHVQDTFGVELATHDHVVMQMDAAFRCAGASGGVQPECRFVFAGERGLQFRRGGRHQRLQRVMRVRRRSLPCLNLRRRSLLYFALQFADDNLLQIAELFARNRLQMGKQRLAYNGDASAAIVEDVLVVLQLGLRIDGNSHCADLDRAEKGVEKFGRVQKQKKDAFFGTNAESQKNVADAVGIFQELQIGDALVAAFDGDFGAAAFLDIAVHEVSGDIERIRQRNQELVCLPPVRLVSRDILQYQRKRAGV